MVPTRLVAALLLALLPTLAGAGTEPRRQPGVIAHRGVSLEAPENTLPAIQKAIDLGCAMAEIDLRYTADGEVVLLHDATVDRTTDGSGRVAEKKLAELKGLDAGARTNPGYRGTRVPTLKEAVELARGRIELYLDLKEPDPRPVVRVIEQLGARSMVVYRPYTYRALRRDPRGDAAGAGARRPRGLGAGARPPGDAAPRFPHGRSLQRLGQLDAAGRGRGATAGDDDVRQRARGERYSREPAPGGVARLRLHPDRPPARAPRDHCAVDQAAAAFDAPTGSKTRAARGHCPTCSPGCNSRPRARSTSRLPSPRPCRRWAPRSPSPAPPRDCRRRRS